MLQRLSAGGPISITVDGRSAATRRGLRTVQLVLTVSSSYKYAVIGDNDLKISSGGTDSYDSDVGAYGGGNVGTNGDIRSNGTISQLSGSSYITGDATVVGSITVSQCGHVHTGTCQGGQAADPMPDATCPAGYSPASDVPISAGVTYNALTGVLLVSGGSAVVTLDYAHTPYRFSNLTLQGGATLTFQGTPQHVDLYVSGVLSTSGGSVVNPTSKPINLTIWGCGANTSNWVMSGGTGAYFAVYAPNHQTTVSGGGAIYGALMVGSLVNSGGSWIHYDEALGRTSVPTLVPGSWAEVPH